MSYQTLIILGNVGKSEIRTTQNGKKVASFSVAVSEGKDKTTWFSCIAFEKTAEVVERYVWEVIADRLSLESPKEGGSTGGGANTGYSGGSQESDDLDSEIPF